MQKQCKIKSETLNLRLYLNLEGVGLLLGEDFGHALGVAVDCVEKPGEGKAEDGSEEEHPDYYLLLDWSHERHVGPKHVHEAQTEEKQTT